MCFIISDLYTTMSSLGSMMDITILIEYLNSKLCILTKLKPNLKENSQYSAKLLKQIAETMMVKLLIDSE